MEAEKAWQLKRQQYLAQREQELQELEKRKKQEEATRYLIEQEKNRLLRENEQLLKKYYPLGYQKAVSSLRPDADKLFGQNPKHEIIYNNIFGNSNPNKASVYPKYGKVKNFVYDIDVQEVEPHLNIENYKMYNATLNNNFDSYPTQEEYKNMMDRTGQKYYQYAGEVPGKVPFGKIRRANTNVNEVAPNILPQTQKLPTPKVQAPQAQPMPDQTYQIPSYQNTANSIQSTGSNEVPQQVYQGQPQEYQRQAEYA